MSAVAKVRSSAIASWKSAPRLRVVPVSKQARRTPFVVTIMSIVSVGLVGLIFLSTVLQQQAFEIAKLDSQISTLTNEKQSMSRDLDRITSPAGLGKAAAELGMVPNPNPVFIQLSDGTVKGKPKAASSHDVVRVSP